MPNIKQKLINAGIEHYGFKGLFDSGDIIMDADTGAAMAITAANVGVPVEYLTYMDPQAIEILTAPRNSTELFDGVIKGDWTTERRKYRLAEVVGNAAPYGDFSENGVADTNNEFVPNDYFRFQTLARWGDLETERNAAAKISLVSDRQRAAATIIAIMENRINMYGIAGLEIYGIMNHPLLPANLTATAWGAKDANAIFKDIQTGVVEVITNSNGWINAKSNFKIGLSPKLDGYLATINQFGLTVGDMVKKNYPNATIVTVPEFSTAAGEEMYITATDVLGQKTSECVSGMKLKTFRVIPEVSSYKQKWAASAAGFCLYMPFAISRTLVA